MKHEKSSAQITLTLRKLYKGSLFIGIGGIYATILGMMAIFVSLSMNADT